MAKTKRAANSTSPAADAGDEAAIRRIPEQMIDAWNKGSGEGFAAPYAEDGHQTDFEGTHLRSRKEIAAFHQQILDTVMKGSQLVGQVDEVRFITPDMAVMKASGGTIMPDETEPLESRNSIQMFVVQRENGKWQTKEVLSARKISLERQQFVDDFNSLSDDSKRRVKALIRALQY